MLPSAPPIPNASRADYRRQARRLRHRLSARPAEMHRALRELAIAVGPASPELRERPRAGLAQRFADHVERALDGRILRYSARLRLLRHAERQGIDRFEANLVIATVQHRLGHLPAIPAKDAPQSNRPWPSIGLFVLIESFIVGSIWWIVHAGG